MPTPVPQWLPNPKTSPTTSHSLPTTHHTAKEGGLVDHFTLSGSIGAEEIPSSKGFPWQPWLPGSEKGRNSYPDCASSELCCLIWNAHGSAMWSGVGAPPMFCPPGHLKETVSRTWRCWMLQRRTPWLLFLHLLLPPLLQILERMIRSYRYLRSPALKSQRRLPIWRKD